MIGIEAYVIERCFGFYYVGVRALWIVFWRELVNVYSLRLIVA